MAFLDQDQPIDYSNRYNENIGSISPRASASRPNHSTNSMFSSKIESDCLSTYSRLSSSQYGDLHMQNSRNFSASNDFANNFNGFHLNASFSQNGDQSNDENNFNQNNRQSSLIPASRLDHDFVDCAAYVFENAFDARDSVTIYQTEDTPIPFSNLSSVGSLSLERLPQINPEPLNTAVQSVHTFKHASMHETELNSSGDSLTHYNMMESSPYCFSYESTSPLSLDLDCMAGELTPETVELFNTRILKKQQQPVEQDITSMLSCMSIDHSTRTSTERLNRKETLKFGHLNDDAFSLLDMDEQQPDKFDNQQRAPSFLNSEGSVVSNQEQSQSSDRNSGVDFEQGFDDDEYDNNKDLFYLNKCISIGRMTSNKNAPTQTGIALQQQTAATKPQAFATQPPQQQPQPFTSQPLNSRQFSSSLVTHPPPPPPPPTQFRTHHPEEIPYTQYKEGAMPFSKKELLKQREASHNNPNQMPNRTTEQFTSHPVVPPRSVDHHRPSNPKQQPFIVQSSSPPSKKALPSHKQFVKLDSESDIASTVSSEFSKKYSSRANYTIDGKEEPLQFSSVPYAPIIDQLKYPEYQQSQQALQKQKQLANQQQSLLNSGSQVKVKGIKKIFKSMSKSFKNL